MSKEKTLYFYWTEEEKHFYGVAMAILVELGERNLKLRDSLTDKEKNLIEQAEYALFKINQRQPGKGSVSKWLNHWVCQASIAENKVKELEKRLDEKRYNPYKLKDSEIVIYYLREYLKGNKTREDIEEILEKYEEKYVAS